MSEVDHAKWRSPDSETVEANEMFLGQTITLARIDRQGIAERGPRALGGCNLPSTEDVVAVVQMIRAIRQQGSHPFFADFEIQ